MKLSQNFVAVACLMSSTSFVHATPVAVHGVSSRTGTNTAVNPVQTLGHSVHVPDQYADTDTESEDGIQILRARTPSVNSDVGASSAQQADIALTPEELAKAYADILKPHIGESFAVVNAENNGPSTRSDGGSSSTIPQQQETPGTSREKGKQRQRTPPSGSFPLSASVFGGTGNNGPSTSLDGGSSSTMQENRETSSGKGKQRQWTAPTGPSPLSASVFGGTGNNEQREQNPFDANRRRQSEMEEQRRERAQAAEARQKTLTGRKKPSFLLPKSQSSSSPSMPEISSSAAPSNRGSGRGYPSNNPWQPINMSDYADTLEKALDSIDEGKKVRNLSVDLRRNQIWFNGRFVPFPRGRSIHNYTPERLRNQLV